MSATTTEQERPPRDNLLRLSEVGVELRVEGEEGGDGGPVMAGHFAVFDQWTEINSWEGNFLEKFAPGAFKKTIRDQRDGMKVLFQHGFDYMIGDKPLGPIEELREDDEGVYYEVPLLDAPYVRDEILPGLEQGLYGASFRFRVIREEFNDDPGMSDDNPQGLPERVVKEVHVPEFGPVTFPAYAGASAGLRSARSSDLAFAAAYERVRKQDTAHARDLAVRFAAKDEPVGECLHPDGASDPDDPALCEECRTKAAAKRDERESEEKRTDAPPGDSAEASGSHPADGRRANRPPLSGIDKQTPPWRRSASPRPPWRSGDKE